MSGLGIPDFISYRQCKEVAGWFPETEEEFDDLIDMTRINSSRQGSFILVYQYSVDSGDSILSIEPEHEAHQSQYKGVRDRVIVGYVSIEFFAFDFYTYEGVADRRNVIAQKIHNRVNRDIYAQIIRYGWLHLLDR